MLSRCVLDKWMNNIQHSLYSYLWILHSPYPRKLHCQLCTGKGLSAPNSISPCSLSFTIFSVYLLKNFLISLNFFSHRVSLPTIYYTPYTIHLSWNLRGCYPFNCSCFLHVFYIAYIFLFSFFFFFSVRPLLENL